MYYNFKNGIEANKCIEGIKERETNIHYIKLKENRV